MRRLAAAYRRLGPAGVAVEVRARLRRVMRGRTFEEARRDLAALWRDQGPRGLAARARYGVRQLGGFDVLGPEAGAPAGVAWRDTFAYAAASNPFFDLTADELAANREVVERFSERPGEVRSATWFLTYFEHALFGGVYTILRLMAHLKDRYGVEHRLVIFDRQSATDEELRASISAAFPTLRDIDIVLPYRGDVPYDELPPTDIAVCTIWISAYALARFNATRAKFYLVQDFEPTFYPAGTLSALAEATYRLGYAGLVNTPGLLDTYRAYGAPGIAFTPAVDDVPPLAPKPSELSGRPAQVVLYGRPTTDRNAFELIAAACVALKRRYGDRLRIVSAGEDWSPAALGLEGVIDNRGLLGSLADVRELYAASDVGICFMLSKHPSYQPFEYLACGVAPVVNANPHTAWLLEHERNCLVVEPFPSEIARAVSRLVDDRELRGKLVETGHRTVAELEWEPEFDRVWRFITNQGE